MTPEIEARVAQLLRQSRTAHQAYQRASGYVSGNGSTIAQRFGSPVEAQLRLKEAATARASAETLDPTFSCHAWSEEPRTIDHRALTAFYAAQLAS